MIDLAFTLVWFGLLVGVAILVAILGHMTAQTLTKWPIGQRRQPKGTSWRHQ